MSTNAYCKVLEYGSLTMQTLLEPTDIEASVQWSQSSQVCYLVFVNNNM